MKSPLEQAQEIKKKVEEILGDKSGGLTEYELHSLLECKSSAQTLLETCEWMLNGLEEDYENGLSSKDERMIEQTISICKEILK